MNIEKQYLHLLKDILDNGVVKEDRTGVGTKSVFGRMLTHNMKDGFPLMTTKKVHMKSIVHELLWFLNMMPSKYDKFGNTNSKYLVDNGVNIWNDWPYKEYKLEAETLEEVDYNLLIDDPENNCTRIMTMDEFIGRIKIDDEFAMKWGKLGPVYGAQWRDWGGHDDSYLIPAKYNLDFTLQKAEERIKSWQKGKDQILEILQDLEFNPDSRRIMVNAWNVAEIDQMSLPPCHYGFQLYTRKLTYLEREAIFHKTYKFDGRPWNSKEADAFFDEKGIPKRALSLMWQQRSVDTLLGLPFNIASYAILLAVIAKHVNMVPEELKCSLGDTHLYLNHLEYAKEQISRKPYSLPKLNIKSSMEAFWFNYEDIEILNYKSYPNWTGENKPKIAV